MKIIMKIFVAFCVINFLTFAQDSEYKTQSFKIGKGGRIDVSLAIGDIVVNTWNKDEVLIKYNEDEYSPKPEISKNGSSIKVISSGNLTDDFIISIPSQFNVDLKTSAGDVKINGNISGRIEIKTSGGDISLHDVSGTLDVSTDGGNIKTGDVKGNASLSSSGGDLRIGNISGSAEIKTAGGNIQMQNVGSNAEVKTAGGNIQIQNIGGNAEIKTGGGNISVQDVTKNAEVKTGGGNIAIKSANGIVDAKTGAGNISLKNIKGSVQAATGAGEVYVELIPDGKSPSEIKSNMGDIKLFIPSSTKATITAETSGGWSSIKESEIKSDFKSAENSDENHKKYILNGGGVNISLKTNIGNIEIRSIK